MNTISAVIVKCFRALTVIALSVFSLQDVIAQNQQFLDTADSIVKYQLDNGGWVKNQNWRVGANAKYIEECRRSGIGATIDNRATWGEMEHLARAYSMTGKEEYRKSFIKGLHYLLSAQYPNGGWPQYFPARGVGHYSSHITFNDGAMINVMRLMRNLSQRRSHYSMLNLSDTIIEKARRSYEKGVECVLSCQIVVDGEHTVWGLQHDSVTLQPTRARAYELPSFCAHGETVEILNFLMEIDAPSERVVKAVTCAIKWLEEHEMEDVVVERYVNSDGNPDVRLVSKERASGLWARFYDLQNAEPLFCGRDGVPHKRIEDIEYERRMGYSWFGNSPKKVIDRFKYWLQSVSPSN